MRTGKSVVVGVVPILAGLLMAPLFFGGCRGGPEPGGDAVAPGMAARVAVPEGAVHLSMTVPGLDSHEGERNVEVALEGIDGVYRASANHDDHAIDVWYDPGRADANAMRAVITGEGYSSVE